MTRRVSLWDDQVEFEAYMLDAMDVEEERERERELQEQYEWWHGPEGQAFCEGLEEYESRLHLDWWVGGPLSFSSTVVVKRKRGRPKGSLGPADYTESERELYWRALWDLLLIERIMKRDFDGRTNRSHRTPPTKYDLVATRRGLDSGERFRSFFHNRRQILGPDDILSRPKRDWNL
jgi:hypothetical protein